MAPIRPLRALTITGVSFALLCSIAVGCGKEPAPAPAPAPVAVPAPAVPAQTAPAAGSAVQSAAQIQLGMSAEQVQQIMGAPGKIEQKGAEIEWKYYGPQGGKVEIKMVNNRVSAIERE